MSNTDTKTINKTCLITGGNSGIGKAAAIQIATRGYRVIIGCRNESRGNEAVKEITTISGNYEVELQIMDLSSQESIRNAAEEIKRKHPSLDVLIHNAADFDLSRKLPEFSPEGIETVWATNHIGPVLLTDLLMDRLMKSVNGRVITVASKGLLMFPGLEIDLDDPEFRKKKYSVAKAYYHSKLAQIMYTYWLAEALRETSLTANCIRVTNVKVDLSRYPDLSPLMKSLYKLKSMASLSPERMAETYTLLATGENLDTVTGKYFDEKNRIVHSSAYSRNKENIKKVMDLTMSYLNQSN